MAIDRSIAHDPAILIQHGHEGEPRKPRPPAHQFAQQSQFHFASRERSDCPRGPRTARSRFTRTAPVLSGSAPLRRDGPQARNHLGQAEGLADVIVGTGLQSEQIDLGSPRERSPSGSAGERANRATERQAIQPTSRPRIACGTFSLTQSTTTPLPLPNTVARKPLASEVIPVGPFFPRPRPRAWGIITPWASGISTTTRKPPSDDEVAVMVAPWASTIETADPDPSRNRRSCAAA